jgi:hypothetical protein
MPYIDLNGVSQSLIILQVESVGAKQRLTETKYENAFLRVNLNTHPRPIYRRPLFLINERLEKSISQSELGNNSIS